MTTLEFIYELDAKLADVDYYVKQLKKHLLELNMDMAEDNLYDLMERYCNEYEICARALRDKLNEAHIKENLYNELYNELYNKSKTSPQEISEIVVNNFKDFLI